MGFGRPLAFTFPAFTILVVAAAPLALAFAAKPPPGSATPAASAPAASAPASSAGAAAPASSTSAGKTAAAELAKLEAAKTKPGDPKTGQAKAAACAACHGPEGNSTVAQYPKLAGQSEQYIVAQLMRFKSGTRVNAIMNGMAAPLSPQEMHDIGAYFAAQKRSPGVADDKLVTLGEALYRQGDAARGVPACMACHGPDGAGNPGWRVPDIAGQHAQYVEQQLKAWHDGTTWGPGVHDSIMPTIAKNLTDEDITAVSSYVQGLHASPPLKAPSIPDTTD